MTDSILIVDGNDEYRESIVDYFRKREFDATGLGNYEKAIVLVAERKFDIAIVDYFIGRDSGSALCEAITSRGQGGTALIVTSEVQSTDIELSIRAHAPAIFLIKPVPVDNLYAVALKIVESRAKRNFRSRKMTAPV
jgi:DNA-binding NtrC family response regulator